MKHLKADWLTAPSIDFEYKKYVLLDYLQYIEHNFLQNKLYPFFEELHTHHKALLALKARESSLRSLFPRKLDRIDLKKLKLQYSDLHENSALLNEIGSIIEYAVPHFESVINEGKVIRSTILDAMEVTPIGVIPLYRGEGYLLLHNQRNTRVYEYRVNLVHRIADETHNKSITTRFVTSYRSSLSNTFEYMKGDLVKNRAELPNPATYLVQTEHAAPEQETLLPLARQVLYKYVAV